MLGPSTSSERSTMSTANHIPPPQHQQIQSMPHHHAQHDMSRQADFNQAAVAVGATPGLIGEGPHGEDGTGYATHQHPYNPAIHFQQVQQAQQAQQAQLQQFQLLQQQQQRQQQQQQQQQPQLQIFPQQLAHHGHLQGMGHQGLPQQQIPDQIGMPGIGMQGVNMGVGVGIGDYGNGEYLTSKYMENEIIKSFPNKRELVQYVKNVLNDEEQCKIVINSSKPKAVYFQCERSGSFRTTVKDLSKRQRVAYTKRNKCGYRLVANLYPPEKDKKRTKKPEEDGFSREIDDKLNGQAQDALNDSSLNEIWILRMIHPEHNHPPEPNAINAAKKKRAKFSRTLVEKPVTRGLGIQVLAPNFSGEIVGQHPGHHLNVVQASHPHGVHPLGHLLPHDPSPTHSVQDPSVIAAMEATPNTDAATEVAVAAAAAMHHQHPPVDPNIDPNVDPSVQEHDHAHASLR